MRTGGWSRLAQNLNDLNRHWHSDLWGPPMMARLRERELLGYREEGSWKREMMLSSDHSLARDLDQQAGIPLWRSLHKPGCYAKGLGNQRERQAEGASIPGKAGQEWVLGSSVIELCFIADRPLHIPRLFYFRKGQVPFLSWLQSALDTGNDSPATKVDYAISVSKKTTKKSVPRLKPVT